MGGWVGWRGRGNGDFLTKTWVFENSKFNSRPEGPKRDLPAEDDFGPELVKFDTRNQSFFDS